MDATTKKWVFQALREITQQSLAGRSRPLGALVRFTVATQLSPKLFT